MPLVEETFDRIVLILKTIREHGSLSQADLARKTGINYNTVVNLVDALVARGLLDKKIDPGPPRRAIIVLTEKGGCLVECLLGS